MSLAPGTHLGPYEIVAPIGAGGMGEVYRARDTRLNRDVAIKVLPDLFARDAAVAQGKKFAASIDQEDMKVLTQGDTAVASYRFLVHIEGEGIDIRRRYRGTDVWLKREGTWQIIGGHMSSLDPQGAR